MTINTQNRDSTKDTSNHNIDLSQTEPVQFFLPQVLIDFEQCSMLTVYFSNLLNEFYSANNNAAI